MWYSRVFDRSYVRPASERDADTVEEGFRKKFKNLLKSEAIGAVSDKIRFPGPFRPGSDEQRRRAKRSVWAPEDSIGPVGCEPGRECHDWPARTMCAAVRCSWPGRGSAASYGETEPAPAKAGVLDNVERVLDDCPHLGQRSLDGLCQIPQALRQGFDDAAFDRDVPGNIAALKFGTLVRSGVAGIGEDILLPAVQQGSCLIDIGFVGGAALDRLHHPRSDIHPDIRS